MSTARSKAPSKPPVTNPAPPGDHRKRKRNRTTQSCLNCHASKRMCDRKRPACQRCTTLGLTGLCVYEVDDPSQRCITSDEKALLRNRVAELEGVVREMKNKPHPRWAQKLASSEAAEYELGQDDLSNTHFLLVPHMEACPSLQSDPGCSSSSPGPASPPAIELSPVVSLAESGTTDCNPIASFGSVQVFSSVPESPSPIQTIPSNAPPADFSLSAQQPSVNSINGLSIENLFTPGAFEPTGFETGVYGHMLDHIMAADVAKTAVDYALQASHPGLGERCSCINNTAVYNTLLELSVRLRKTVECFDAAAEHRSQDTQLGCQIYNLVRDLDRLTSNSLAEAMSPSERQGTSDSFFSSFTNGASTSVGSARNNSNDTSTSWPRTSPPVGSAVDGFMSWEAMPREAWP